MMDVPRPNSRLSKTLLFICIAVLANSFGNLMLAIGMEHMPSLAHIAILHYVLDVISNPFVIPGAALSAVYTLAQISLFSWADLSFVIPCTATSYALTTLLGEFILNEHVQWDRWMGVCLILCGVVLVARTPVATKPHSKENPA